VLLAGVHPELATILRNVRFHEWLPADRIYAEKEDVYSATLNAVRYAYTLMSRNEGFKEETAAYYLV
jgi:sulfate permease, SulP family